MMRECGRYGMDPRRVEAAAAGEDPLGRETPKRSWWELLIILGALGVFVWLGSGAEAQDLPMNLFWTALLVVASLGMLVGWYACALEKDAVFVTDKLTG